jgi:hypothetical protein
MAKHKRWSDKPKSDTPSIDEEKNVVEQETSIEKESKDIKSLIISGTKYIYIVAAAALLSGIFTPLTLGIAVEEVIFGMLIIFLGLGGGIAIFQGVKTQKFTMMLVCGGLGMMVVSLILIYELINKPLF